MSTTTADASADKNSERAPKLYDERGNIDFWIVGPAIHVVSIGGKGKILDNGTAVDVNSVRGFRLSIWNRPPVLEEFQKRTIESRVVATR